METTYDPCIKYYPSYYIYPDDYYNYYDDYWRRLSTFSDFSYVMTWIIVSIGLPLTLVSISALVSLIKPDRVAPVYVINLLISDLIQLCCLTARNSDSYHIIIYHVYYFGVMASVGFMVCISFERYLIIARPLEYRFRQNMKTSVMACVVVWFLPLVYALPVYWNFNFYSIEIIYGVFLLFPLPLFIFFLVGTLRALSAAIGVPADEKRRIVALLVVVLLKNMLLFLPTIILSIVRMFCFRFEPFNMFRNSFVICSPLADLTLSILLRKGPVDKVLSSLCCCNMDSSQPVTTESEKTSVSAGQSV